MILPLLLAAAITSCPADSPAPAVSNVGAAVDAASGVVDVHLSPSVCEKNGTPVGDGELTTPEERAIDAYCGDLLTKRAAPNGFVTVFGSARMTEGGDEYAAARAFGSLWTRANPGLPIATGGGPGVMEAANRGAKEAGGKSIGFGTYFGRQGVEKPNAWTTDAHMFSDFSIREDALMRNAKGAVFFYGGFGTGWELFDTLSQVQTGRLAPTPIILVGGKQWDPAIAYMKQMAAQGTIAPADLNLIHVVNTPEEAVSTLKGLLENRS
jgi:uncharacterized protein (TIGR00730 family)